MFRHAMIAVALLATPAVASQRTLAVPADKGWGHAATGLAFPANIVGLPRTAISDSTGDERDVSLNYEDAGRANIVTIFVFHPALESVGLWFDRAQVQIEKSDIWGGATPMSAAPIAFARPGATVVAGLRQSYRTGRATYPATGLAVIPVGEWLVSIRLSTNSSDMQALDQKMDAILAAIRWPANAGAPAPATPIAACATSLRFGKARMVKRTMEMGLMGSLLAGLAAKPPADAKITPAKPLCRDGDPTVEYGVYHADEADADGYTLAFGDAGRVAYVGKGLNIPKLAGTEGYTVSFRDVDGSIATYQNFDRLPAPGQVMDEIEKTSPVSRTEPGASGNTNIIIDTPR